MRDLVLKLVDKYVPPVLRAGSHSKVADLAQELRSLSEGTQVLVLSPAIIPVPTLDWKRKFKAGLGLKTAEWDPKLWTPVDRYVRVDDLIKGRCPKKLLPNLRILHIADKNFKAEGCELKGVRSDDRFMDLPKLGEPMVVAVDPDLISTSTANSMQALSEFLKNLAALQAAPAAA